VIRHHVWLSAADAFAATGGAAPITVMARQDALVGVAVCRTGAAPRIYRTGDGSQHWTQVLGAAMVSLALQPGGRGLAIAATGKLVLVQ
jgi:hypothetical protein